MESEVSVDIDVAEELRQGDILRWEKPEQSAWADYSIVVTADCDLAHNKMRSRISYVPLVPFDSYVSKIWGPDYVQKKVSVLLGAAVEAIRRSWTEVKSGADLTPSAVIEWIERDDPSVIGIAIFGDTIAPQRPVLERAISRAKTALRCKADLTEYLTTSETYIKRISARADELIPNGGNARIIKDALNGHCNSLPGDVFFVGEIPGEGNGGYFSLLRHVTQCPLDDISLDPARRPGPVLPLRRIGRLNPPFVYAMTQQLAKVFSDIGLPKFYEDKMAACVTKYLA